jgi:hypothetical protein
MIKRESALNQILVNGITLQAYLETKIPADLKRLQQDEIVELNRSKYKPCIIGRVKQEYDTTPGQVKCYSKWEVLMENLKPAIQEKEEAMRVEATMDRPNRVKLLIGALCHDAFQTSSELRDRIQKITNIELPMHSIYGSISTLCSSDGRKPLSRLLEVEENGYKAYRLYPPAWKISLTDLYQLSLVKGKGTFSLQDAIRKVPEIGSFLSITNGKVCNTTDLSITDEPQVTEEENPPEKVVKKYMEKDAVIDSQPGLSINTSGQEIKVTINVNFSSIKILFGLYKGSTEK